MDRYIPETLPFTKKRLPIRVIISYIFDYAIIVILAAVYALIDHIVIPFRQPFSLRNYTIQYPYAVKERIPIPLALVFCVLVPMGVIALYTLIVDGFFSHRRKVTGMGIYGIYRLKDRLWELNCGVLGLLLAEGAAFVITGSLKNLCGKPRPDLIDRCKPVPGSLDPLPFGLANSTICTETDKAIMSDGFRSFPSGHSSAAFAGLFYLSLYLAAKLHVLDSRGEVWKTFIVLIPTLAASCIAMSRIMDARHHPFDVLFGSVLGILVAWAAYRQYFPPVSETWRKGRAYPIRTWGTESKGPMGTNANGQDPNNPHLLRQDSDMDGYRANMAASASGASVSVPNTAGASPLPPSHLGSNPMSATTPNVFRDQISRSQRHRQDPGPGQGQGQGPYTSRNDGAGDWSASSSEDDVRIRTGGGGGVSGGTEGFEMQRPRYTGQSQGAGETAGEVRHQQPVPSVRVQDEDTEYKSASGAGGVPRI